MSIDVKTLTEQCVAWIKNWFENYSGNAKGVILGISGGKDSTVVAALCTKALGKDKVLGILMPNGDQLDIADSVEICEFLGIKYRVVNIMPIFEALNNAIRYSKSYYEEDFVDNFMPLSSHTQTNIPPRIRMTVLYAIGQELGYRVAGTGNASEAFVGYTTKYGDSAYDFNPIGELTTEEVIAIGDYLGLPKHLVYKTPSDGLCGKSDEENLGFTYEEVNKIIKHGTTGYVKIDEKIWKAHQYNLHKLFAAPKFMPMRN